MTLPQFLDFEASSLGVDSYPTEVAWSMEDGSIESHLINPFCVEEWTDWSQKAQALTGISREMLREQGRDPAWICGRMNEVLAGRMLYCDGLPYDRFWLSALYEHSRSGPPAFALGDCDVLWRKSLGMRSRPSLTEIMLDYRADLVKIDAAKTIAGQIMERMGISPHRAGNDVRLHIETHRLLMDGRVA